MLGGGVFVTQNKVLPGSYINFVNTASVTGNVGERGVVAIPYALNKSPGEVIEITATEFAKNCEDILGIGRGSDEALPFREIFCHANKCIIYDLGTDKTPEDAISALEPYEFNILAVFTTDSVAYNLYGQAIKAWRDAGKKCQIVMHGSGNPNHEGIILVRSGIKKDTSEGTESEPTSGNDPKRHYLVPWVAGAEAACELNESCTNMLYDGELNVDTSLTQSELEEHITAGHLVFHSVYGEARVLEDINSLTATTDDKGEDFKNNQTIRVIDQIANDIAKIFNTKYLGRIPNNAAGRVSLWGDIIAHHRQLETIQAIENFDATLVTVEQGETKKSVVVNDVITPVNAMSQLYMTVVVQ